MSTSHQGAILAYDNRFHTAGGRKPAAFTDVGETFLAAQPLTHLGRSQLSQFVQFDGATAELDCQAQDSEGTPVEFACDVLALLGHNLPAGTLIQFIDDTALLAAHTVRPYLDANPHTVVPLPAPVTLDTLTIKISGAGEGRHRISVPWAGPSLRFLLDRGWPTQVWDTGRVERSQGGTPWANAGDTGKTLPVRFRCRKFDLAYGLHLPGATLAPPGAADWDTDNSIEEEDDRYVFQANGTLLAEAGFFTAGKWYELEVICEYGAGQGGTPIVEVGTGNQWALQPGRTQIVGTPDDGSDTALRLVTADGTDFTGAVTWKSIRECTPPTQANAKTVIEKTATTEPVIWLPRSGQSWHQVVGTYGLLQAGGQVQHVRGPVHDVQFNVEEAL